MNSKNHCSIFLFLIVDRIKDPISKMMYWHNQCIP